MYFISPERYEAGLSNSIWYIFVGVLDPDILYIVININPPISQMVLSLTVHHVTDHVSLACLPSTLLQAVCRPLLPGCKFWCGRVLLLTRQAKPNSSSAASP